MKFYLFIQIKLKTKQSKLGNNIKFPKTILFILKHNVVDCFTFENYSNYSNCLKVNALLIDIKAKLKENKPTQVKFCQLIYFLLYLLLFSLGKTICNKMVILSNLNCIFYM